MIRNVNIAILMIPVRLAVKFTRKTFIKFPKQAIITTI